MSIVTIFTLFFGMVGVVIMLVGMLTYFKGNKAKDWGTAVGRVTTSQINRASGGKISYSGWVVYEYSVFGQNFRSQNATMSELMGILSTGKTEAEQKVSKYPVGATVNVYYDPNDPSRSVLEITGDSTLLILGGIFVVFALVFYLIQ